MHLPVWILGFSIFSISVVLIWIGSSTYGLGLTTDSFSYINAAICFRNEFRFCDGEIVFSQWPPLLPVILALLGDSYEEIASRASYLQAGLFGALTIFTFFSIREIANKSSRQDWLALFGGVLVVTSFPIFRVGIMVWSELLFIFLSLVSLFLVYRYIRDNNLKLFCISILLSALPPMTRYIGITVPVAGALGILFFSQEDFKKRFFKSGIYIAASLTPLALWCIRNINLVDVPFGPREGSNLDFSTLSYAISSAFSEWWAGGSKIFLAFLATLFLVSMLRSSLPVFSRILIIWVGAYLFFLSALSLTTAFDPVSNRLLATIAAPILIVVCLMIGNLSGHKFKFISGGIFIWWLLFLIPPFNSEIARAYYDGAGGYKTRIWQNSETYAYLKHYPVSIPIITNADEFIAATFNKKVSAIPSNIEEMNSFAAKGDVALVFFKYSWRKPTFSLDLITPTPKSRRAFSDGEILTW